VRDVDVGKEGCFDCSSVGHPLERQINDFPAVYVPTSVATSNQWSGTIPYCDSTSAIGTVA
jgi:hypothetical protein